LLKKVRTQKRPVKRNENEGVSTEEGVSEAANLAGPGRVEKAPEWVISKGEKNGCKL